VAHSRGSLDHNLLADLHCAYDSAGIGVVPGATEDGQWRPETNDFTGIAKQSGDAAGIGRWNFDDRLRRLNRDQWLIRRYLVADFDVPFDDLCVLPPRSGSLKIFMQPPTSF